MRGPKAYAAGYFKPFWPLAIINVFEEFTSTLTLGLRLMGISLLVNYYWFTSRTILNIYHGAGLLVFQD